MNVYGLDVSSGVETDGFKDREKIKEIVRRVRNEGEIWNTWGTVYPRDFNE